MELNFFNTENTKKERKTEPALPIIRLRSNGALEINKVAMEALGLKENARVQLCQDKQKERDWYLAVIDDEKSFTLRPCKGGLKLSNKILTDQMFASLGITEDVGFQVCTTTADEKLEFKIYALLTVKPILSPKKKRKAKPDPVQPGAS